MLYLDMLKLGQEIPANKNFPYSSSSMPTINAWFVKSSGKSMLTPKYVIYKGDSNRELRYNGTVNQGTLVEVRIEARPTGGNVSGASNIL